MKLNKAMFECCQSNAGRYENSDKLMSLVKHAESDAWLSLGLCFYLNVLPLTRQLSNLSGSLWSKALQGQRAQRIEMLLLHEFHEQKFMLPDKLSIKVSSTSGKRLICLLWFCAHCSEGLKHSPAGWSCKLSASSGCQHCSCTMSIRSSRAKYELHRLQPMLVRI